MDTQGLREMDVERAGSEGGSRSRAGTAKRAASLPDNQGAYDSDEFKSLKLGQTAVNRKYCSPCVYIILALNFLEANTKTVQNTKGCYCFSPPEHTELQHRLFYKNFFRQHKRKVSNKYLW